MVCFSGYFDTIGYNIVQPIETLCSARHDVHPISRGVNEENLVQLSYKPIGTRLTERPQSNGFSRAHVNLDRSNLVTIQCKDSCLSNATLATVNARSLKSNLDVIKPLIHELNIDILCLNETWLRQDDEYTPREFTPAGYSLFRVDRFEQAGGGVAILCHSGLKPKQLVSEQFSSFEHVVVNLSSDQCSLRVVSFYRPPSSSTPVFLEQFSAFLEDMCLGGSNIIIAGDMNIQWDKQDDSLTKRYRELLYSFGISQNVAYATHIKGHTLDHILTRDSDHLSVADVHVGDFVSDHNLIYTSISIKKPESEPKKVCYRKINEIDIALFKEDILASDLCKNYSNMDLDTLVERYDSELRSVLDRHAPQITQKRSLPKREPWYSKEIHYLRRQARAKERKFRKSKRNDDRLSFERARSEYRTRCKNSKILYYEELISSNSQNPGKLFKITNQIMRRKNENPLPEHTSPKALADQFGNYFINKVNKIRDDFNDTDNAFEYDSEFSGTPLSQFQPLSTDELNIIIAKAASTSCELDPIPTGLLKSCLDVLSPVILRIINLSITQGTIPNIYKAALVRPLLKKPSLDNVLKNYRPVSNLTFLSKLIEEAVNIQFTRHIETNVLNEELQSAYRQSSSTETALLKIFDDVLLSLDNRQAVLVSLLDLSAAFDTVDHSILLRRLEMSFGVKDTALKWFTSYLNDRTLRVVIDDAMSEIFELVCSVPQGSKLGPRLYSQYTRFLGLLLRILLLCFHCYADDTQLQKSFNPRLTHAQNEAKEHLENGILEVARSLKANKLKLNKEKTEFLILISRHYEHMLEIDSLHLDDEHVSRARTARNLGVTIDSHMSLEQQINDVRKKCFYFLKWIKEIRPYITENLTKVLVHALVISRLDYCNALYIHLPRYLLNRLQSVLNYAARVITKCSRDDSISAVCRSLHWLPISERIVFKVNVLVYKALHKSAPSYMSDMIKQHNPRRSLRSSNHNRLVVPKTNLKYGERAFSVAGPKEWNKLPEHIKNAGSLLTFRKLLKTHLFQIAYEIV